MQTTLSFYIPIEKQNDKNFIDETLFRLLHEKKISFDKNKTSFVLKKKSIDARRKTIKCFLQYNVFIDEEERDETQLPVWIAAQSEKKVVIVGSGPAGLFAALRLLEVGIMPIIVERGEVTDERRKTIANISRCATINSNSNYCFGEGGAGTFSDGKLYTRSDKRGNVSRILKILCAFGASEKILTASHPHIGTNKLPAIINAIREKIISLGGVFYFNEKCIKFILEKNKDEKIVQGLVTQNVNTLSTRELLCDAVLLATGHSAFDMYEELSRIEKKSLEAKAFAIGVRVEHPRALIDAIQFHGKKIDEAAEYRLTSQVDGRGVYSFCMCPGGFIVPAMTGENEIVVNGMSNAKRNSLWSNAAIVVETKVSDTPKKFLDETNGNVALAGLYWRRHLERETFLHGDGARAPAQRLVDFLAKRKSSSLPETSYTPGIISSELHSWLPDFFSARLADGFRAFEKKMHGFISEDALLVAIETRTSSPCRISRDSKTGESPALKNLFPAGEGAGFAGGIVSSAMDGELQASKIILKFAQEK